MTAMQITKLTNTTTRATLGGQHFGQIKRDGRQWHAEVRDTITGERVRFAGIWSTRRDALEEVEHLLRKPEHT